MKVPNLFKHIYHIPRQDNPKKIKDLETIELLRSTGALVLVTVNDVEKNCDMEFIHPKSGEIVDCYRNVSVEVARELTKSLCQVHGAIKVK